MAGALDIYDVFNSPDNQPPDSKMTEPLVLDGRMIVTDALYRMQQARKMMAIVRDGAGKHVGVATIKDIVEEIVGELESVVRSPTIFLLN